MQRRIGLAQALINDPDLVILDEPTSGLDPIGCREVKDLILALARRGKTVILSSHLLADVEDVCDRVVIYYGGRIQAMGTLKELLATPDRVRITTPILPRETLERALQIIRAEAGEDRVRLDTPTQNLESYFLGVVERAKQTEATSGATSGARVAAYLRGEADQAASSRDKLLDRLTLPQAAEAQSVEVAVPAPQVDEARLAALTGKSEPPAPVAPAEPTPARPEMTASEIKKADQKLADLLGDKSS
jgi:ABC-2 type transport system ATP-binding protein